MSIEKNGKKRLFSVIGGVVFASGRYIFRFFSPAVCSYSLIILTIVYDFVHILRLALSCNYSFVIIVR